MAVCMPVCYFSCILGKEIGDVVLVLKLPNLQKVSLTSIFVYKSEFSGTVCWCLAGNACYVIFRIPVGSVSSFVLHIPLIFFRVIHGKNTVVL